MTVVDIPDNIHKIIMKKQLELFEIEGKKTNLVNIVERAIIKGINLI